MKMSTILLQILIIATLASSAVLQAGDLPYLASTMQPSLEQEKHPGLGDPVIRKITGDVWCITNLYHPAEDFHVNAGVVFTENSVVFIDSGMTIASAEFIWNAAAQWMKGGEELYLILTHHHSDHVFGTRVFKDRGATIIGHEGITEELAGDNGFYKNF